VAMECPQGSPTVPKVLCESVERIGRLGFGFGGVDLLVDVHLEHPGPDWSDLCRPPI
jgi:hypothetical protein